MSRRASLTLTSLGWVSYAVSLFMSAVIFRGGELTSGTWSGWDALTRGWVVWAAPFMGNTGLRVILLSTWLGLLWLTNILVPLSISTVLGRMTIVRRKLRWLLPCAAAGNLTFLLAPDVHPVAGYYFWLASFILLATATASKR